MAGYIKYRGLLTSRRTVSFFKKKFCSTEVVSSHARVERLYSNKSSPVTGPEWPRGFQEVKAPRFRDNGTEWW